MKKLIVLLFFASLFSAGISIAQTGDVQTSATRRGQFVDKNKDGICDNYQNFKVNPGGRNFVDKNNDGICDDLQNPGSKAGCPNFVDKNKD